MAPDTVIYLVRHAESAPSPDVPEPDWPLSETGRKQANDLVPVLTELPIAAVYSSPYPRAIDTVGPYAEQARLAITPVEDLRERSLTTQMAPENQWREWLERTWTDFDWAPPGGETNNQCQQRVGGALNALAANHAGEAIAAASHGNAIALFLNSIDSSFGHDEWRALTNPDLFAITYGADGPESFERIAL